MEHGRTPVAASPRHISQFAFGPVSGLVGCTGRVLDLPDSNCRLPGPGPSGVMTALASTYRCGGSTGIAHRSKFPAARTCFPLNPLA